MALIILKMNLKRYYLLTLLLVIAQTASANQSDFMDGLETLLYVGIVGAISVVLLVFSVVDKLLNLLAQKEATVSIGINLSSTVIIICAFIVMALFGEQIAPEILLSCIGAIIVCLLLIVLNYKTGNKSTKSDENKPE